MAIYCLTATIASVLPSSINLFINSSKKNFLLSLINASLGFFLFSFQVHEKSILLVTLPVILAFPLDPVMCIWLLEIATFSMFPLLQKDGLFVAFLGLQGIFLLSIRLFHLLGSKLEKRNMDFLLLGHFNLSRKTSWKDTLTLWGFYLSLTGQISLLIGQEFIKPPENLPYLYPYLISAFSGLHFMAFFLYFNEVVDESDGCGGKFSVIVVSALFEGKPHLQRHRLVNSALAEELKTIHAFSQKTYTPAQWTEVSK
uniref:dolichyl-P-Glc:Man9GlcNAc2-PP-dolichol alpha-1,3-glucosyltransferase n=1 Tax=Phlebotomus papatasi TaxID=29031 RepID=A0A1B0CYC9_PHLPP